MSPNRNAAGASPTKGDSDRSTLTDISHRKKLERELRRDHIRISALIEALTAGTFLVNKEGALTEMNLELANLLEIEPSSLIGRSYQELFARMLNRAVEPEVAQQSLHRAVTEVGEKPSLEITLGTDPPRHLEIAFFPVWEEDGSPLGWGGLVQDVTEVRERWAWKIELLSILAHDIRAPLATLKGHATALLANFRQWSDEMVSEFLEAISRSTDALVHQVDRSLTLTRVEAGRLGLRPEACDVQALISNSIERAAGALGEANVQAQIPEELPEVRADPARVEEVIVNLLVNAARYTPADRPIRLTAEAQGPLVAITVTDQGKGVPPSKQAQIFDRYQRADSEGGGTGLGLYISRKIVEAHGGRIKVVSPLPGGRSGSSFIFTLPRMPTLAVAAGPDELHGQLAEPDHSPHGLRVLVVEDEADSQALLRAVLSEAGYRVELATNGPNALEIVQTASPDLVLLDWMLPGGMDGPSVSRNIRRWSDAPILMLTSKTSQQDLIKALDAGADDYVTKPFHTPELLARIKALARRREVPLQRETDRLGQAGLLIDFQSRRVWLDGQPVQLTPTEYGLLSHLARHRGQVLTYDQLLEHVYGSASQRSRHDLFAHVSRLRKKLEPRPGGPRFIETRWGVGYLFAE